MMIYTDPPEWHAEGQAPPEQKRTEGWKPTDRVPASWLNWFWHRTAQSLREIAQAFINHRDASAPHDGHETKEGATAKVEAHSAKTTDVHGVGAGFHVAKTTRADQRVGWDDVVDKPTTFTVAAHNHDDRYYRKAESDQRYAPATHSHGPADLPKASTTQQGIVQLTSDRTSTANNRALTASAMNAHITSSDHDQRYHTKAEISQLLDSIEMPVQGVESGVASDGDYVVLPFENMPHVILQPFDMMVYSPDHSNQKQRIHVYPEEVSPQGFRVVAKTVLEAGDDVEHTFPKQQYQAPRFNPCRASGHGTPGDLFSAESLYNVGDKVVYMTTHDDVTRVEVQVREMMHVHAYAGNYSATNRLSYRVRIREVGASGWLRTFGPVQRSRNVKSSLLTTSQTGSHNLQSIVFENLPAGKYEIEIEITDKTVHASNGDNRWNSCWLIVEKWIESRGEPIEAANPARVQWLAIETDEEA